MTKKFYGTVIKTDKKTFGGNIYLSDFNTNYTNGNIAQRIISDLNFDNECKRNIEQRTKSKIYMEDK